MEPGRRGSLWGLLHTVPKGMEAPVLVFQPVFLSLATHLHSFVDEQPAPEPGGLSLSLAHLKENCLQGNAPSFSVLGLVLG